MTRIARLAAAAMVLLTPCSAAGGLFASDLPEIPGSQAAIEAFLEHDTAAAESLATAALNRYEPASLADSLACVDLILLQAKCRYNAGDALADPRVEAGARLGLRLLETAYGTEDPRLTGALGLLADIRRDQYAIDLERQALERRLDILNRDAPIDTAQVANSVNRLGGIYWTLGDLDTAEHFYRQALVLRESIYGGTGHFVAASLNNLGIIEQRRGHLERAVALHEHALELRIGFYGEDHFEVGQSRDNLAECLVALGRFDEAWEQAELALAAYRSSLGPKHWAVANPLSILARLSLSLGELDTAKREAGQALDLVLTAFGPRHPQVVEARALLASVLWALGSEPEAFEQAQAAEVAGSAHLRLTLETLSTREGLIYAESRPRAGDAMLSIATETARPENIRTAWSAVAAGRLLVLDELLARARERGQASTADRGVEALRSARKQLLSLQLGGPRGASGWAFGEQVIQAQSRVDSLERLQARATNGSRSPSGIDQSAPLERAWSQLKRDEAMVTYARYDSLSRDGSSSPKYAALVLGPGEQGLHAIPLGSASLIDSLTVAWQHAACAVEWPLVLSRERAAPKWLPVGVALRERVWDAIAEAIGRPNRLYVIRDGSLLTLPLDTLPTAPDSFLIDSGIEIYYLTREVDLIPAAAAVAYGDGLLAIGNPANDDGPGLRRAQPGKGLGQGVHSEDNAETPCVPELPLPPLPGAEAEVRGLAALLDSLDNGMAQAAPLSMLLGREATEANFRHGANGKRLLHLAVHGYCCDCVDGPPVDDSPRNPLLDSGLVLAGVRPAPEPTFVDNDGILSAEEVGLLDLAGVECVVLTACQAGDGDYQRGEGLVGLQWAFRAAGAGSLVLSPWTLQDEWVQQWVPAFYEQLLVQGMSVSVAARQASLAALQNYRTNHASVPPAAWGAMTAVGSP